jgi:chemotaxis protein MotB
MARKKKAPEHENHERWLVSYADFITLLFAFFVVMFASAQADEARAKQVSEAVRKAFRQSNVASVLGGSVDDKGQGNAQMKGAGGGQKEIERAVEEAAHDAGGADEDLAKSLSVLSEELKDEIRRGEAHLNMEKRGLVISLAQTLLFNSGDADAFETAYQALDKVARAINRIPNPVRLEGHTDSRPISNSRYRSNWELSAARSIAILEILSGRGKVERERLSIGGYADVAPIGSNDTTDGRARNRRVDIVILNAVGQAQEPPEPQKEKPSPMRH